MHVKRLTLQTHPPWAVGEVYKLWSYRRFEIAGAFNQLAIAFQLCFTVCHYEGLGKLEWFEIKWYTPVSG
jgi:hypothetical protein